MEKKIVFASQSITQTFGPENERLLLMIGEFMDPDDPQGWAEYCWVSDESQLGDFRPEPEDLAVLSEKLGFQVELQMYLYEICARMRGSQGLN